MKTSLNRKWKCLLFIIEELRIFVFEYVVKDETEWIQQQNTVNKAEILEN